MHCTGRMMQAELILPRPTMPAGHRAFAAVRQILPQAPLIGPLRPVVGQCEIRQPVVLSALRQDSAVTPAYTTGTTPPCTSAPAYSHARTADTPASPPAGLSSHTATASAANRFGRASVHPPPPPDGSGTASTPHAPDRSLTPPAPPSPVSPHYPMPWS